MMTAMDMAHEIIRLSALCEAKDAALKYQGTLYREAQAQITMQDEALRYIHPYFIPGTDCSDRMSQAAEELIEQALSATSETVAAWRAKEIEPYKREVAMPNYEELESKLNDALNKIKASQEHEPFRWLCEYYGSMNEFSDECGWIEETHTYKPNEDENFRVACPLYATPVIPPDVAELQRKNAELTRKLAAQQVHLDAALTQLQCACSYEEPQHVCEYHRKLLAEATRQGANEAIGNYMPDFSGVTPQPGGSNE